MEDDVGAVRARLSGADLDELAELLIGVRAPAVRMRPVGGPASVEHGLRVTPARVVGLQTAAVAISAFRGEHVLAVLDDGSIAAWGDNSRGQLGDGSRADSDVPVGVRDLDAVVAVASGAAHSVALRRDGSVFSWGDNEYRQVCDAERTFFTEPVPVSGLDRGVRAIAAGERNSFAVLDDGSVLGWGSSNLGPGAGAHGGLVPIPGLHGMVVSLASGRRHTLALVQDGSLFAWGGSRGAIGDGTTERRFEPVRVRGLDGPVAAIAAGSLHSLALMADGTVMAWGSNSAGAIGHGMPVTKELEPVRVPLPGKAVAIAAGGMSNHALLRDGSLVSWGANSEGQLADGTVEDRFTPVPMRGLRSDVQAITLGAALLNDGSICRWGGTLAPSDDNDDVTSTGASKLGGRPDLPQSTVWPHREARPMVLLAQVDVADAAACADFDEPLPRGGLLSLFVEPEALGEQGSWQLLFTEPGSELTRLPTPAKLAGQNRIAAVPLVLTGEMSWPPPYSTVLGELGLSSSQIAAYERAVGAEGDRPIHRMLGHPALIQPPDPRDADPEVCLLMQIDSDDAVGWQWGDVGCIYVWIRRADLAARRFDRAVLSAQSA